MFWSLLTMGIGTAQCTVTKSVAIVPSTWRNEALPEIKLYKKLILFPHMGFKLCKIYLGFFFFSRESTCIKSRAGRQCSSSTVRNHSRHLETNA